MKKTLSLSLILISSLFFLSACGVKPDNNSSTTTPSEVKEEPTTSSFSLRDLIAKNIPQKCTWSSNFDGSEANGIMIIQGNKFNQEVNVKQEGADFITHSISDGTYIYSWQENSSQTTPGMAIKMKLETINSPKEDTPSSDYSTSKQTVDLDQQYQYNCSPTVVSEADFQPPKDIKFTDYSQFLEDIQSKIPSINPEDFQ